MSLKNAINASSSPYTHPFFFLDANNISDEYTTMYLFSTKSPTAKTGPLISANNSYNFSYKMGKEEKAKKASHASAKNNTPKQANCKRDCQTGHQP